MKKNILFLLILTSLNLIGSESSEIGLPVGKLSYSDFRLRARDCINTNHLSISDIAVNTLMRKVFSAGWTNLIEIYPGRLAEALANTADYMISTYSGVRYFVDNDSRKAETLEFKAAKEKYREEYKQLGLCLLKNNEMYHKKDFLSQYESFINRVLQQ